MATIEDLKRAVEHAPADPGPIADGLTGWKLGDIFICAHCAGRIFGRGCGGLLSGAAPVWGGVDQTCQVEQ